MVSRFGSTFNYLLRGLGIGSVVGILYAPKSGEDTRKYLAQKARDGSRYARGTARPYLSSSRHPMRRCLSVLTHRAQDN